MPDLSALAEKAVETAKEWDIDLDYSAESIASLERLVQIFYQTNKNQHLPENVLWNMAAVYGAYLGETLLRNELRALGFEWGKSDEGDNVIRRENNWMSPISKMYKRLTNGPEDSIESFYTVSIAIAKGEIPL